jgi:hypothetical protein
MGYNAGIREWQFGNVRQSYLDYTNGAWMDVAHPEYISQTPSGRLITIGLPDGSFVTVDLLPVTGIRKPLPKRN